MLTLRHKKSHQQVNIPTSLTLKDEELPYATTMLPHRKYQLCTYPLDDKSTEALKNFTRPDHKLVFFEAMWDPIPNGVFVITPQATWEDIRQVILTNVRKMDFDNPKDIVDVAFGVTPHYVHAYSKIIDTREGAMTPYEVFPDRATVHVTMFKRASCKAWKPLMVGYKMCEKCGSVGKLKVCSGCRKIHYCSAECQKADWADHKADCKKE